VLLIVIPGLALVGLVAQVLVGPGPSAGFRTNRGIALLETGRPELAWAEFREVIASRPGDSGAWLRGGRALRAMGRPTDAIVHFRRSADLNPESETARFELAMALLDGGYLQLAGEAAAETLALEPDHAGGHYVQAAIAAQEGDVPAAVESLARSLECGPAWPDRFRRDPLLDPVRNDIRFQALVVERRVPGLFRTSDAPGGLR
jgi:tetratricopeptide (TPR) repeat protein